MFKIKHQTVSAHMFSRNTVCRYALTTQKTRKRTILVLIGIALLLLSSLPESLPVNSNISPSKIKKHIILDAGHGFPDGGAIGISGTIESTINIKIAKKTKKILSDMGYNVTLTRKNENALTDEGKTIAQKKRNDMYKRLQIINESNADMFVSIHMNKFTDPVNRGAQVIYSSKFPESTLLAEKIQTELCNIPENTRKRSSLKGSEKIFLLKNSNLPAVIVECGFISNFEEEQQLNSEKYQNKIALAIADGIKNYYSLLKAMKDGSAL